MQQMWAEKVPESWLFAINVQYSRAMSGLVIFREKGFRCHLPLLFIKAVLTFLSPEPWQNVIILKKPFIKVNVEI